MSKDTNMLFKPAMVRGLLSGSKTMTRRLFSDKLCITEDPGDYKLQAVTPGHDIDFSSAQKRHDDRSYALFEQVGGSFVTPWIEPIEVPQGEVGDRVYVRETHYRYGKWLHRGDDTWTFVEYDDRIRFEDDAPAVLGNRHTPTHAWHRRPGLFMPKGLTRIILEITEKKVERLRDISEEDARREGVEHLFSAETIAADAHLAALYPAPESSGYANYMWHGHADVTNAMAASWPYQYSGYNTARESFFSLWAKINGVQSVEENPWVVALGLKRVL